MSGYANNPGQPEPKFMPCSSMKMKLELVIKELKSRKRCLIQEEKDPTYNLIVISHTLSKEFLSRMRKKIELRDIKSHYPPGFETKLNITLPTDSIIFMKDSDPVAAWIGGKLKLMTKKK